MSEFTFKLPDIGEGIAESEIAAWRVEVGQAVEEDQPLVDMLTDKAAVELVSPVAGTVRALRGEVGDKVAVGSALVILETGDTVAVKEEAAAPANLTAAAELQPAMTVAAAPTVRRRARELGIDLRRVEGSGPSGRVLHEDLARHAGGPSQRAALAGDDDAVETVKLVGLRRRIAEAMERSARKIPHFAYVEEIDVTELESLRARLNQHYPERPRLTVLPLLIQALVRALRAFPQINSTFDETAGVILRYRALHAGIATQTPSGLVVPVLRHAQRLSLWQRASGIQRLAKAARAGKCTREELSGSTLTITSLGPLGGIVTTPIINAPEVAIVGVNRILQRPVVRGGKVEVRAIMNLSSSFDHRIIDGYDAASFIQQVKQLLESPAELFIPDEDEA